jgi:hypothetical protein
LTSATSPLARLVRVYVLPDGVELPLLAGSAVVCGRRWLSQNCASRRHLEGGNPPAVEHDEPVTMPASKYTGVLGKR